jgi:hypothetical protein
VLAERNLCNRNEIYHPNIRKSIWIYCMLQCQHCRTTTYQSSFYNRVTKIWNPVCKNINIDNISNPISFKRTLKRMYSNLIDTTYDVNMKIYARGHLFVTVLAINTS